MEEPTSLKHYEILSRLGEGGMGVVYRARDTRLGRVVALKMLPGELAGNEDRSRRFEREAKIVSTLSHPGIATLYDFDRDGETAFLTMELVQGSNLRQVLGQGAMPLEAVIECAVQVTDALAAAHRNGVVHRDLKPENIMAAESGYYKVLDFGVARLEDASRTEPQSTQTPTRTWATKAGTLIGTVAYMSPEQILGKPADARSDIFSLGCVLYEMVTSEPAFSGPSDIAIAHSIAYEPPQPLSERRKDVPRGFAAVIDKCLTKEPEQRYQTAEDLATDLRTLRMNTMSGARAARGLLAYDKPVRRVRRRVAWGLAAGVVVAVLALAGWKLSSAPDSGPSTPRPAAPTASTAPGDPAPVSAVRQGRPRVVVAFFENNTGDADAEWISLGLPEMLTTDLAASAALDVIATQRLHDLLASAGREPGQGLDRSSTAELARWAGAEVVISGSVFKAGGRFRIDVQAYDTDTGTVMTAHKAEGSELFSLVDELTTGLLAGLKVTPRDEETRSVTDSEEAFQAYVSGEDLYESLMFGEARDEYARATEADPDFALARLHLAMSSIAGGDVEGALPSLERLASDPESLPQAEGLLALALSAYYVDRDFEAGTRHVEELVERFPNNGDAYVWWSRALFDLGDDPLEAARKLHLALEQDPNDLLAVATLAGQLRRLGATEDARAMLFEARRLNPEAESALTRMLESDQP